MTDKKKLFIAVISAVFSAMYVYQAAFGFWEPQFSRGLYIMFAMVLSFLINPERKKKEEAGKLVLAVDYIFAATSVLCILYFISRYEYYSVNAGIVLQSFDVFVGLVTMVLVVEACRRCIGISLPIVTVLFIVYCYFGKYIPDPFSHKGFSIGRIVSVMFAGTEGIFGSVAYTFSAYIFLFIIFGAFLQKSGAGDFFIEVSKAVVGKMPGGAGQASVISSWILGSIMGSSTANTAITGAVTIPLMIENGYKKHVAASIEAVVSIGGQFMPPVMGAAAFIMASMIGAPYSTIVIAGLIPAIFFFLSMMFMVYLEAKRTGLKCLPPSEVPKLSNVMKAGWFYLIPIGVIVYFLARGDSPTKAGFWSIVATFAVSYLNKEKRMGPKQIYEALADGAKSSLSIASTAGVIGMLVASISLPGLGMKISSIIMRLSNGNLIIALVLVMIASFILGMGMNVTSAYLLLVTLTAPALVDMGVPLLTSHFFVFWTSQLAVITPPVCLSAYVAASIAGADVWKTGWYSLRMGLAIYYMPILFIYMPGLLFMGTGSEIAYATVCSFIAIFAFSCICQGYMFTVLTLVERMMLVAATITVILIGWQTDLIGLILIAAVIVMQLLRVKRGSPDLKSA